MSIWAFLGWEMLLWAWCRGLGRWVALLSGASVRSGWGGWLGLSGLFVLLPFLHLVLPMQRAVAGIVTVICAVGWFLPGIAHDRILDRLRDRGVWLLVLVAVGWAAAMSVSLQYDSGLYYQQIETWARVCPAVPGLGNLHGRLAFPNASFLLTALLDHLAGGPWGARLFGVFVVTNGFLHLLGVHVRAHGGKRLLVSWTSLLSACFVVVCFASPNLVVAAPDLLVAVLITVTGLKFLEMESGLGGHGESLLPLLASMVFVKTSSFVFAGPMLVILFWRFRWRPRGRIIVVWGTLFVAWALHNWIQSGYVLFPFLGRIGTPDWAMRVDRVHEMVLAIRGWSRWMGPRYMDALEGWWWLQPWVGRTCQEFSVKLAGAFLAASSLAWVIFARNRSGFRSEGKLGLLTMVCAVATVLWFSTAPDIRFHLGVLWIVASMLSAALLACIEQPWLLGGLRWLVIALLLAVIVDIGRGPTSALNPKAFVHPVRLPSGLMVYMPDKGDQVWRAPIPATPELTDLRWRGPSLCDGFRDGAMEK